MFCIVIRHEHKMKLDCVVYFVYCIFPNSILKVGFIEKTCISDAADTDTNSFINLSSMMVISA